MDFSSMKIDLHDDATVETIKRLFSGMDIDECIPCIRSGSEIIPVRRIVIEGSRLVFEAY